jgi:hypothetical protein
MLNDAGSVVQYGYIMGEFISFVGLIKRYHHMNYVMGSNNERIAG